MDNDGAGCRHDSWRVDYPARYIRAGLGLDIALTGRIALSLLQPRTGRATYGGGALGTTLSLSLESVVFAAFVGAIAVGTFPRIAETFSRTLFD